MIIIPLCNVLVVVKYCVILKYSSPWGVFCIIWSWLQWSLLSCGLCRCLLVSPTTWVCLSWQVIYVQQCFMVKNSISPFAGLLTPWSGVQELSCTLYVNCNTSSVCMCLILYVSHFVWVSGHPDIRLSECLAEVYLPIKVSGCPGVQSS
jgi:hypothetical protein